MLSCKAFRDLIFSRLLLLTEQHFAQYPDTRDQIKADIKAMSRVETKSKHDDRCNEITDPMFDLDDDIKARFQHINI
jgi:hypothetical protein